MPYLRLTILRPIPDRRERARELLEEIDHLFAEDPEMIMSFEFGEEGRNDVPLGRVAVWQTSVAATRQPYPSHP